MDLTNITQEQIQEFIQQIQQQQKRNSRLSFNFFQKPDERESTRFGPSSTNIKVSMINETPAKKAIMVGGGFNFELQNIEEREENPNRARISSFDANILTNSYIGNQSPKKEQDIKLKKISMLRTSIQMGMFPRISNILDNQNFDLEQIIGFEDDYLIIEENKQIWG